MSKKIVTKLNEIPAAVREGSASLKVFYFWALNQGEIKSSMSEVGNALGFTEKITGAAYKSLKEEGLLNEIQKAQGSVSATFEISNKKSD